jgi:L-ascorbate metabolism protein UlaG (beta-lactamase superfamily)
MLRDEISTPVAGVALWWLGNAGWLVKSGELLIATDLDLDPAEKVQEPPVTAAELSSALDAVLITHQHGDHCNLPTLRTLARESRCVFVLPRTCLEPAAELDIPPERIIVAEPHRPFDLLGMRVEPIHAIHGDRDFTVLTHEEGFLDGLRYNCGYVLTIAGIRMLQPGDSLLTEEHLALQGIDVLFVSPTVHNMYLDRSLLLINRLEPAHIFPQHFGTYREHPDNLFWTRGYPDELATRLSATLRERFHRLRLGERFELNPSVGG